MKSLVQNIGLGILLATAFSCSDQNVILQKAALSKEEVLSSLENNTLHITKVERKTGDEITDLTQSLDIDVYRKDMFFIFRGGFISFYTGHETIDDQFPPTAQTFTLQTRIAYPAQIQYYWDEARNTVAAYAPGESSYIRPLPVKTTAFLDVSSIVQYKNIEEAKAALIPPSLKFTYSMPDKNLGEVTYVFTLKPVWFYERVIPGLADSYVMF
jgi:hypothetical protein